MVFIVSFVESVVQKFMLKGGNKTAKVMSFLVACNLFATLDMRRVMIAKRNRAMLLDHIVKAINSKKKDKRLVRRP